MTRLTLVTINKSIDSEGFSSIFFEFIRCKVTHEPTKFKRPSVILLANIYINTPKDSYKSGILSGIITNHIFVFGVFYKLILIKIAAK